jgi:hypothetical protein
MLRPVGSRFAFPWEHLPHLMATRGVTRIWQLNLLGGRDQYELDPALLGSWRAPGETYWTAGGAGRQDWLLYVSHADTIIIAGDWLIEGITHDWPEWRQYAHRPRASTADPARLTVLALVADLTHGAPQARRAAALHLGNVHLDEQSLPGLVIALGDGDSSVSERAGRLPSPSCSRTASAPSRH